MHSASNFWHQKLEADCFFLRLADLQQIQTRPNTIFFALAPIQIFELQVQKLQELPNVIFFLFGLQVLEAKSKKICLGFF
jgi:hypothetical protein